MTLSVAPSLARLCISWGIYVYRSGKKAIRRAALFNDFIDKFRRQHWFLRLYILYELRTRIDITLPVALFKNGSISGLDRVAE